MNNSVKTGRIASIDILRGIAIIGMVLCANIGFNSDLPAWMFHAQTPPPTYAFNPDVPGITWVDLVFPFFLFSMGAAFPFAMRKRLEKGQSRWAVAGSLVKRWLILTVFAIVLGNAYSIGGSARPAWQVNIYMISLWAAMFLALVRIQNPAGSAGWKSHLGEAVNISGLIMLIALAFVFTRWFGLTLDKGRCDIIIMILAVIAIAGGLLWMFTKDSIRLRWLVFMLVAAFKAMDSYAPEALSFVPSCTCVSWFFNWEWLQYLLIVLPGSIVGDMILEHSRSGVKAHIGRNGAIGGLIAMVAAIVQLWGLFTRNVAADFIITGILAIIFFCLTWKERNVYTGIAKIGFFLLLAGIIFDPVDGGITKDYCNLSYVLTTGGMAALTTAFLLMLEIRSGVKGAFIAGVGQNPMLAYTVTNFLIGPVLNLTCILPLVYGLSDGSQFWGVMQGVFITFLMMCVTFAFTRLKLFWRS